MTFFHRTMTLLACAAALHLPAQISGTGTVRGTIFFGDTGAPAQGTFVNLLPPAPPAPLIDKATGEYTVHDGPSRVDYHAQVDAEGHFTITNVPPGTYTVLTYAPGYLSPEPGSSSGALLGGAALPAGDSRQVRVSAGATRQLSLQLQRGGTIEGYVYSGEASGVRGGQSPVAGIAVNVERELDNRRLVRTGGAAHTDSAGHYQVEGLAPGNYVVFTTQSGSMVQTSHGLIGTSGESFFAPGTVRASRARVTQVREADTVSGINVTLPSGGLHTISGTVVTNGSPASGFGLVRLYPTGEPGLSRATPIGVGGVFSFGDVPDEQYTLSTEFSPQAQVVGVAQDRQSVRMRMGKAPYKNATMDVNVGGNDVTGLVLQVSPPR